MAEPVNTFQDLSSTNAGHDERYISASQTANAAYTGAAGHYKFAITIVFTRFVTDCLRELCAASKKPEKENGVPDPLARSIHR